MSLWSCLFYIAANIAGLVLHWLYYQERIKKSRRVSDPSNEFPDIVEMKKMMRYKHTPSILARLGFQAHHTFFAFEDHFNTFEEVSRACKRAGLEKCGLIIGVDFSASNEWQGRKTFSGQNLHKIVPGRIYNPYQKVISIIGKTLEPFDDDNLIPAFGFGDSSTLGMDVFPFISTGKMCCGFSEVLDRYCDIATKVKLGGPTNFAPVIFKAIDIVKERKKYHILIIIADGQVNEEDITIAAIVEASKYPLSIIVVGVGDGPWGVMENFDNCLPQRKFDNFQFVNFHAVTAKARNPETAFALHALMEIPDQYKTIKVLGYLKNDDDGNGNCIQSIETDNI